MITAEVHENDDFTALVYQHPKGYWYLDANRFDHVEKTKEGMRLYLKQHGYRLVGHDKVG